MEGNRRDRHPEFRDRHQAAEKGFPSISCVEDYPKAFSELVASFKFKIIV